MGARKFRFNLSLFNYIDEVGAGTLVPLAIYCWPNPGLEPFPETGDEFSLSETIRAPGMRALKPECILDFFHSDLLGSTAKVFERGPDILVARVRL